MRVSSKQLVSFYLYQLTRTEVPSSPPPALKKLAKFSQIFTTHFGEL